MEEMMRRSETLLLVVAAMAGLWSAVTQRRHISAVTDAMADYSARLDDLDDLGHVFLNVELDQVGMLQRVVDRIPDPSGPQRLAG
jgi:hypothetical protein